MLVKWQRCYHPTTVQGTLHAQRRERAALLKQGVVVTHDAANDAPDEEVQRVLDAIDELGADGSAEDRARRLTALLDQWPDTHARVRAARQRAVKELHDGGMSYRKIAGMLGVSFGRVRQIIDGESAGPAKRKKAEGAEDG